MRRQIRARCGEQQAANKNKKLKARQAHLKRKALQNQGVVLGSELLPLLEDYRDNLLNLPYERQISNLVDCCDFIIDKSREDAA